MTVLKKNESYSLFQNNIGVSKIRIFFYMDLVKINQQSADADVVSFLLDKNDKLPNEGFFVFYNNLKSSDNSVIHNGDIITRDDELDYFFFDNSSNSVTNSFLIIDKYPIRILKFLKNVYWPFSTHW